MEHHLNHSETIEDGCYALCHLSSKDKDNKSLLVSLGICDLIIRITDLHYQHASIVSFGFIIIGNLSRIDTYRTKLVELGAIELLVKVMQHHVNHVNVAENGCLALTNFADNTANRHLLHHLKVYQLLALVMTIHSDHAGVVQFGCLSLGNLCCDDDIRIDFGLLGACGLITRSMDTHIRNTDVVEYASHAIKTVAHLNDSNQALFIELGLFDIVIRAIEISVLNSKCVIIDNRVTKLLTEIFISTKINDTIENVMFAFIYYF